MSEGQLSRLQKYSACDISDALLKLEKVEDGQRACAGFLDGIILHVGGNISHGQSNASKKIIAPAFTVQFQPNAAINGPDSLPKAASSNINSGSQWSDSVQGNTIVVVQQPEGQKCAVVGGIHALNIDRRGTKGIVVSGRIRDIDELRKLRCPIWARGTSTVGASAEAKAYATQVPINIGGILVKPGDIVFCDIVEGVVVIPRGLLEDVMKLLKEHAEAEEGIKYAVKNGMSVSKAFALWR
ncbi:hypothetical protein MMC34_005941 [Xylographa carneopallida]|nr:hypothetical protein [Xylographa carneopallida]